MLTPKKPSNNNKELKEIILEYPTEKMEEVITIKN